MVGVLYWNMISPTRHPIGTDYYRLGDTFFSSIKCTYERLCKSGEPGETGKKGWANASKIREDGARWGVVNACTNALNIIWQNEERRTQSWAKATPRPATLGPFSQPP